VIMQSTLGGTLDAGLSRVTGTVAGALLGGAGAWAEVATRLPLAVMLSSLVLPLSLLATLNAKFRMAPVTAALVLPQLSSASSRRSGRCGIQQKANRARWYDRDC